MAFDCEVLFVQQLILKDLWMKTSIRTGGNGLKILALSENEQYGENFSLEEAFGVYVKRQTCGDGFGFCMKMTFTFEDGGRVLSGPFKSSFI
ncbi:unnamed protein product [Brugia timori]|uniref:Bm11006 n=2 Tax=Brugia TaxID=6278 RepID=A0A0J9Y3E3_BRUMA|nr:Bm11006 [Brugia malayi]VDO34391.1 unnamed protein product [Brugia timori]